MKTRYPAIALLIIIIFRTVLDEIYPLYGPPPIISSLCEITSVILIGLTIYTLISKGNAKRKSKQAEELERQREIERKEINMVRKSNEILLHLIQDEHREEDR